MIVCLGLLCVSEVEVEDEAGDGKDDPNRREKGKYDRETEMNCQHFFVYPHSIIGNPHY